MNGYKVNIEPEVNCYVSENIRIVEIPVSVIDNRDEKKHQLVFFITNDDDDEYSLRKKVNMVCKELGYSAYEIGEPLEKQVEAGILFIKSGK